MSLMKRIGMAVAAGTLLATGLLAAPAQAATTADALWKCDPGWVCIYEGRSNWDNDIIEHGYYNYGFNALYNEWGAHWIVNNQTGGARVFLCTARSFSSCYEGPSAGGWGIDPYDLGPINYLLLTDANGNW